MMHQFDAQRVVPGNLGAPLNSIFMQHCQWALWPVFHDRIDLAHIEPKDGALRISERTIRGRVGREYRNGDVVWVHDYHCCVSRPAPRTDSGSADRFLLHIPFPHWDLFLRCRHGVSC